MNYYITHFFANTLQLQTNVHFRPLFVKLSIILPYEWWKDKEHGRLKKSDWPDKDCRKTGEYFPEVAELLRKMNEDKE